MRKLIISMNISLDGCMSGPNCELDWHFERWSPDMSKRLTKELSRADSILLGRNTYEAMAKYWHRSESELSCSRNDIPFAAMMNSYYKVVYSTTLVKAKWNNSKLIKGNIKDEIWRLKQSRQKQNKDIIVYGSGQLVVALMQLGLVDEYQFWVHPVILGKGKHLFRKSNDTSSLKLLNAKTFDSGVVLLQYEAIYTSKSKSQS